MALSLRGLLPAIMVLRVIFVTGAPCPHAVEQVHEHLRY